MEENKNTVNKSQVSNLSPEETRLDNDKFLYKGV